MLIGCSDYLCFIVVEMFDYVSELSKYMMVVQLFKLDFSYMVTVCVVYKYRLDVIYCPIFLLGKIV